MDCNVKKEDLLTFFYGECEEGEQERIKEHVAACERCRPRARRVGQHTGVCSGLGRTRHLRLDLTFVEAEVPRRRFRLMAGFGCCCCRRCGPLFRVAGV